MPLTWDIPLGVKTDMCEPQPPPHHPPYPPNPQHPSILLSSSLSPTSPHLRGKISLFVEIRMSIPTPLTQVCSSFTPPHPRHIGGNDYRGYLPSTSRGFHSPSTVFPFPCPSIPSGKEWISYWEAT